MDTHHRKCQLVTTGPWREMPNLALIDVSMQPDVDQDWDGPIALWAIGSNGDVLTRLGVTRHCPEVRGCKDHVRFQTCQRSGVISMRHHYISHCNTGSD